MKRNLVLLIGLLLINIPGVFAQAPAIQWQKTFGGSSADNATAIAQTSDGGFITVGECNSSDGDVTGNHGANDYWVAKIDKAGGLQWQKSLGGAGFDDASAVQQTSDGGYILAGGSSSPNNGDVTGNHGSDDCWIVKLDASGSIQWQRSYGGTKSESAYDIKQTTDGGYIIAAQATSNDGDVTGVHGTKFDYWIIKIDGTGTIQWQKIFGGSNNDAATTIQQTTDGGYIVAGGSGSLDGDITTNHGSDDIWVIKLDAAGTLQWQKSFGGSGNDNANSIRQTTDGGYIIGGFSISTGGDITNNHGGIDAWVIKIDASGTLQWQKTLGGAGRDVAASAQQTFDGGYIIGAYTESVDGDVTGNHGSYDNWLVKLNGTGTIVWQLAYGGTKQELGYAVWETTDHGFISAGYTFSSDGDVTGNHGSLDYWIVRFAGDPLLDVHNIQVQSSISVYPNPAQDVVHIRTRNWQQVENIIITGITGQVVYNSGHTPVQDISVKQLQSGLYFINIVFKDGDRQATKVRIVH